MTLVYWARAMKMGHFRRAVAAAEALEVINSELGRINELHHKRIAEGPSSDSLFLGYITIAVMATARHTQRCLVEGELRALLDVEDSVEPAIDSLRFEQAQQLREHIEDLLSELLDSEDDDEAFGESRFASRLAAMEVTHAKHLFC